jgi:lysophospholipase
MIPKNISATPYTQESNFEQVMANAVVPFWQNRNDGFLFGLNKTKIYYSILSNPNHSKAIVIVNGRTECCAKYQELFYDLYQQGYDIYSIDHRGQGLSEKVTYHSDMNHIEFFNDYVADLHHAIEHFELNHYEERYLLAHSMGATIATRYMQTHTKHSFNAVALSAPMFGITMPWYLKPIAIPLTQLLTALSSKPRYAPSQQGYVSKPFANNPLSHSPVRYRWFRSLYEQQPNLQVGGASTRWVWQSLMACKQCLQLTRQLAMPILILQAENDIIVDNCAQDRLFNKLSKINKSAQLLKVKHANHELLFETDTIRNQVLDAILLHFRPKNNATINS